MNCSNCGTSIRTGDSYCTVCGTKVSINNNQTNNSYQYQMNHQQTYSQNNYGDEELIDAYIGKNVDKIREGGFSWNVFFFGIYYTLYRKMWLLSLVWFVLVFIISMFLPSLSFLSIVIEIVFGVKFKELYLKNARESVEKIKNNNPTKSREEIKEICQKKGGTTIIPIVIIGILIVLFVVIVGIMVVFYVSLGKSIRDVTETYVDGELSELRFDVPSSFEASQYNDNSYVFYTLSDSSNYCTFQITTTGSSYYDSALDYLQRNVYYSSSDTVSEITDTNINGITWKYMVIEKSYGSKYYYYATSYGENIYEMEYQISDDDGICSNGHTELLDTLKFEW